MKSYQDCISHPFKPDQKENEWNVRWQMNYNKNGSCPVYHLDCKLWPFLLHKEVLKRNKNSLRCFYLLFQKHIFHWKIRKILFLSIRILSFFCTFFQAQLNLPHLDTSWNWHPYAMEHVRHCQRGKSSVKKSCAIKKLLGKE